MLSPQQFPYTGPYSLPTGSHRSRGPTALALKRMCKRFGSGFQDKEFSELDEHYNEALEAALDKAIPGMDGYGEKRWEAARALKVPKGRPNAGQYALDDFAQELVRDEAKAQPPPASKIDQVRKFITEFCKKGLANTSAWNYSQNRPVDVSIDPSGSSIRSDCSGSVIQAVHYAKRKTELPVQDPAKQNWSGYGNTDLYEDDWPTVSGSYQVGDLAHYQGHVTLCIKAGDWNSSEWWSFGSEPPSKRKLNYRSDFRKVVRPVYLA